MAKSILYHNNSDGTFTDVTEKAGVAAPGWASSAVWFDYDNDGRLDLFRLSIRGLRQIQEQRLPRGRRCQTRLLHPSPL